MANSNYLRGRALEYSQRAYYLEEGADAVIRASGSHGVFDLVVFQGGMVTGVQCKLVADLKKVDPMLKKWISEQPLPPSEHYLQSLVIKVHGSKEVHTVTI